MVNKYQFKKSGKKYNHHRGFRVKYIGPTDYKGSRVGILDLRYKNNTIISYNYKSDNICEMAIEFLEKQGIKITGFFYNEVMCEYYLTSNSFESIKGRT